MMRILERDAPCRRQRVLMVWFREASRTFKHVGCPGSLGVAPRQVKSSLPPLVLRGRVSAPAAALSGSQLKAPGSAGGYLLDNNGGTHQGGAPQLAAKL